LQTATKPTNGRLTQLMPPIPGQKRNSFANFGWQKQLAAVGMIIFLFIGGLGLYRHTQQPIWNHSHPTSVAVTATITNTPTVAGTTVQTTDTFAATSTAIAKETIAVITVTPSPHPATPIAALPPSAFGNQ
jgi:hypothetical protein